MTRNRVIGMAVAAAAAILLIAVTGPRPPTQVTTTTVTRTGGVCLQLEQWALFGWVIRGQAHTSSDAADGVWHTPPSPNPPCEEAPIGEQEVRLPDDTAPDVYRLCGLADDLGCLEFAFNPAQAMPAP